MSTPRGIRNRNPGNIERRDPWQGLAEPHEMTPEQRKETRFCVFRAPEWGIRAIARILIAYQDRHQLDTVEKIIHRWAPPVENDSGAYAAAVRNGLGLDAGEAVDVYDYHTLLGLVRCIVKHENGRGPLDGDWYPPHVYEKGLLLAGIEPPQKPLSKSRTIAAGAAVGTATVAEAVINAAQEHLPQAVEAANTVAPIWPEITQWVLAAVTVAGVVVVLYARWDDRRKGRR